ncbi:hypothetical protein BaRGS_00012692 [Batillaria attramentaria]|uniref:Notch ligand N-terminal domain-containing protein n=1 Tax=Batillaria attramentaria TaxID=370345 RepID=A0ABD0L9N5_9CAEN
MSKEAQNHQVRATGRLYVGIIGYNNYDNRRADGRCCDGSEDDEGRCQETCDLIIQLSITGLDGPNVTDRRLSNTPQSNFTGDSILLSGPGMVNPLVFTFQQWPECVNVAFEILDVDNMTSDGEPDAVELVDVMTFHFALGQPSQLNFTPKNLTGERAYLPSALKTVVRFECIDSDVVTNSTAACPATEQGGASSGASPQSPKDNILDCRGLTPSSTVPPTTTSTVTAISPSKTITSSSTWPMTSYETEATLQPSATSDSGLETSPLPPVTSTESLAESSSYSLVINPSMHRGTTTIIGSASATALSPTTTLAMTTATTTPTPTTRTTTTATTTAPSSSTGSDVTSHVTTIGSPAVTTKADDPMEYWPVILGCVLGGLIIIALLGFLIYSRRQKAMIKRQEIYTVTPRIVSVVEENGTSGKSDIPVETTEY